MKIDKTKPWYWLCYGQYKNSIAFNCTEATRSKLRAKAVVWKRNLLESTGIWFIKETYEHPDRDMKQFQCPECKNLMSKKELNKTWDWAGPHCNACGCTGMIMFGAVQDHAPVMSCKRTVKK